MGIFFELLFRVLGKVFNNHDLPWYMNLLPVLLIIFGIFLLIVVWRKMKNKNEVNS